MRKLIYPRGKIFGIVDIHFGKRQSVGRIHMNLSILLTDFIDTKGMLKTYRFIPINQYNRIVVDRLSDICTDVKGNTDKDVGLLRVYNSDKCQLLSTTCKIKDFTDSYGKIFFCFEHMFIPVESSRYGSCGIYNFILPVDYRSVSYTHLTLPTKLEV